jgi:hypothetical protein
VGRFAERFRHCERSKLFAGSWLDDDDGDCSVGQTSAGYEADSSEPPSSEREDRIAFRGRYLAVVAGVRRTSFLNQMRAMKSCQNHPYVGGDVRKSIVLRSARSLTANKS